MINYIIPTILLISCVYLIKYMIKENKPKESNDEEIRFLIEQRVMRDVKERAEWWDNFNVELYVKYLETK